MFLFSTQFGWPKVILGIFLLVVLVFVLPAQADEEQKQALKEQIEKIQAQIANYGQEINKYKSQASSLQKEINILDWQAKKMALEIEQTNLVLRQLETEKDWLNKNIITSDQSIKNQKQVLAEYIKFIDWQDKDFNYLTVMFSQGDLSGIFLSLQALDNLQQQVQTSLTSLKELRLTLDEQEQELAEKQEELYKLRSLQSIQKYTLINKQDEKQNLLVQTKGEENKYQQMAAQAKKDIESIRNQLYLLEGVGLKMTLAEAYEHAKFAWQRTDVRPAFLLAILKKESSWGGNVGTGTWRSDMHERDKEPFQKICASLGFDPNTMPVSKKPWYGWGGAMGPAQFLPSTWLSYADEVAQLTGHNPPSPWNIDDAFVAAGLKLANAGAAQKTQPAEWKAAMIYFAGSRWNNSVYAFYGDQVMELAGVIQEQLDNMGI